MVKAYVLQFDLAMEPICSGQIFLEPIIDICVDEARQM